MDVDKRISTLRIGNPYIDYVKTISGNYESFLHEYYKDKRVTGEWFQLEGADIDKVDSILKNTNPQYKTEEYTPCPCEKEFVAVMKALYSQGMPSHLADRDVANGYSYEVWDKDILIDGCRNAADKDMIKITMKDV